MGDLGAVGILVDRLTDVEFFEAGLRNSAAGPQEIDGAVIVEIDGDRVEGDLGQHPAFFGNVGAGGGFDAQTFSATGVPCGGALATRAGADLGSGLGFGCGLGRGHRMQEFTRTRKARQWWVGVVCREVKTELGVPVRIRWSIPYRSDVLPL